MDEEFPYERSIFAKNRWSRKSLKISKCWPPLNEEELTSVAIREQINNFYMNISTSCTPLIVLCPRDPQIFHPVAELLPLTKQWDILPVFVYTARVRELDLDL